MYDVLSIQREDGNGIKIQWWTRLYTTYYRPDQFYTAFLELHEKICSFQAESVVRGRRIGIRKGSGDIVYDPRPEDPIVQFKLPGKQARGE